MIVPARLAGPVRRLLIRDLAEHIRADGGAPTAAVRALVYALGRAEHRHDQAAAVFVDEPALAVPAIVEIDSTDAAQLMGCTVQHVTRLCRSGGVSARRIGRAWLIDRASLDAYRFRRKDTPVTSFHTAVAAALAAQQRKDDPEQLARVAELAKTNPTAYADLPEDLRVRAAMHAITPPPAADEQGDEEK